MLNTDPAKNELIVISDNWDKRLVKPVSRLVFFSRRLHKPEHNIKLNLKPRNLACSTGFFLSLAKE